VVRHGNQKRPSSILILHSRISGNLLSSLFIYLTLGAQTILLYTKRMLPEYISTILLWPFALKCTDDWMNNLVHRADGQTPYQALTGLDPISLMFQTSTPLVVLAMSWISAFNLAIQWFQNRSHKHKWACTLDVHPHMLQTLL
jgi:hypothetical protein